MTPEEEIERFFSVYPKDWRKWVELSEEYQLAIKRGNTTAALEIAAVILNTLPRSFPFGRTRTSLKSPASPLRSMSATTTAPHGLSNSSPLVAHWTLTTRSPPSR
jgi:hypothetical protein